MKEAIKKRTSLERLNRAAIIREALSQIFFVLLGFIFSKGAIFGRFMPFGLSFVAAVPTPYLAMTTLGCFFGYFVPSIGVGAFRYIASLFAITAIKALLAGVTKYANKPFVCAFVASAFCLATGFVSNASEIQGLLLSASEALFTFAGAYFMTRTFKILPFSKKGLKGEELTCILATFNMALTGVIGLSAGGVSVGRIIGIAFILISSRFGGSYAAVVSGAAFSIANIFAGEEPSLFTAILIASLLSGAFSTHGKYFQVAAFILSIAVSGFLVGDLVLATAFLIESFFGAAIYLLVPKTISMWVGKMFSPPTKTISENGMKKSVTMRLKYAAGALGDISSTVENVAKELSRINSPEFSEVLEGVENEACAGCSFAITCWEKRKNETISAVLDIIKTIKDSNTKDKIPEELKGKCIRTDSLLSAVYKYYTDYASRLAAERRLSDIRSVVSDQFSGISEMLLDLASELNLDERFDDALASKISVALKNIDIRAEECGVRIDKYGRMTVEIIVNDSSGIRYNRMKILKQVEICSDRDFEPPVINNLSKTAYITLTEKAVLGLDLGAHQISSSPSGVCGDAYSLFADGKGRIFMVLSDGMGSGGRAAVDGAMASGLMARLLKAGFGYDCSLRLVNSAMLFKSTDESLATLDVSCVDLFSGRVDLLKAGAAPTVIRRNGKSRKAQSTSLPAGILRDVGFDKASLKLKAGDIIVMMSDGASGEGTEWISAELEAFRGGKAQDLAELLARSAKRRRNDNHMDDITVIVGIVEKA